jgi:hypothetical protein
MPTLRWKIIGDVLLIVHAAVPPSEEEWAAFMSFCDELGPRMRNCLVFSETALTPAQRRQVARCVAAAGTEGVAVVTASRFPRMAVTALGWTTGIHRAFPPESVDRALDYLGVKEPARTEIVLCTRAFQRELGVRSPPPG